MSMYHDDDSHYDSDFAYDSSEENNYVSNDHSSRVNTSVSQSSSSSSSRRRRNDNAGSQDSVRSGGSSLGTGSYSSGSLENRLASIPSSWLDEADLEEEPNQSGHNNGGDNGSGDTDTTTTTTTTNSDTAEKIEEQKNGDATDRGIGSADSPSRRNQRVLGCVDSVELCGSDRIAGATFCPVAVAGVPLCEHIPNTEGNGTSAAIAATSAKAVASVPADDNTENDDKIDNPTNADNLISNKGNTAATSTTTPTTSMQQKRKQSRPVATKQKTLPQPKVERKVVMKSKLTRLRPKTRAEATTTTTTTTTTTRGKKRVVSASAVAAATAAAAAAAPTVVQGEPKKPRSLFSSCIDDDDDDDNDNDDDDDDDNNDNTNDNGDNNDNMDRNKQKTLYGNDNDECNDADPLYHRSLMKKLVTHKDVVTETFLREVIDALPQRSDLSAPELSRLWKEEAKKRITQYSVTLSHKLSPLVQIMLDQKLSASLEFSFAQVPSATPDHYDMVMRYERCFDKWIDDSKCVSFKATNTRLLGRVDIKDMYVLTFFSFCTCRRTKNDNVLQLGLVGCSTSGKTTVFEACLMEGSHVTTNEQGVGRFQVGNKPVLLFHDIDIRTLAMSKDTEKIKTIARTEPTVTKIHSSTYTLPPLFVFYSSNERLMTHKFSDSLPNQPFQWRMYHGQVNEMCGSFGSLGSTGGRKRATDENLAAIQNRFIECFVRKAPKLDPDDLPQSGGFSRLHGILGMYPRILDILQRYSPSDFFSPVLPQYVLHGLCINYATFSSIVLLGDNKQEKESIKKEGDSASFTSFRLGRGQAEADRVKTLLRGLVMRYLPDKPSQLSLLSHL